MDSDRLIACRIEWISVCIKARLMRKRIKLAPNSKAMAMSGGRHELDVRKCTVCSNIAAKLKFVSIFFTLGKHG